MQFALNIFVSWLRGMVPTLAAVAIAAGTVLPASAANQTVSWDYTVAPTLVSISTGDTVTWNTSSFSTHPLSEANASFVATGASLASSGMTYSRAFASPGTYYFTCLSHGSMRLTVTVTAACAPPAVTAVMDIDGNGQVEAATDGLLVLRYLLGIRGSALIAGAMGNCPGRATYQLIESYLAPRVVP